MRTHSNQFTERHEGETNFGIGIPTVPRAKFLDNLSSFNGRRVDKPLGEGDGRQTINEGKPREGRNTHFKFILALIFFRKLSFVTSSSFSSLSAYMAGGSFSFRLMHSCRITSSAARLGSIRVLTVMPSFVVTLLVGTRPPLGCDCDLPLVCT